ncbi:MAG: OmpH family outer membrane protein [Bacteroidetes bacterium]|nr:MAG: OmpH family outer membrane protein [Bacteroidota bacterium]MBL1144092.1 OmpH family outer membrane protein [Bacteroidota bacterium]NOG56888.1 OmpH family outer membrane protein [Bacteroidota bacterium]
MKNVQWGINILFALIIVYLLVGQTSGDTQEIAKEESTTAEMPRNENKSSDQLEVRYINSDSIYTHYKMVDDLRKDLEARQKQFSKSLENRVKKFEEEVGLFQQNAPTMSQFEGQQKQKELLEKEQELGQMQQELAAQLAEMENAMQIKIRKNVLDHIETYKNNGVDLILDFSSNSSLLMAQDTFDITQEVIESLNSKYANKKD